MLAVEFLASRPTALVVEEDGPELLRIARALHDDGFSAVSVGSLLEAARVVSMLRPAVVILDLPRFDAALGELLRTLGASPRPPTTWIVSADGSLAAYAARFGVPFARKPLLLPTFVADVERSRLLGRRPPRRR